MNDTTFVYPFPSHVAMWLYSPWINYRKSSQFADLWVLCCQMLGLFVFCWVHSIEVSHDSEKWFHFLDAYLSYYNRPLVERKCYKLSFLFQQRSAGFVSKNLNLAMNEFSHIFLVLNFRRLRHEALHFGDEKSHESLQSELTRTRNGPFLEELQLVQQRSSVVVFLGGPNSRPVGGGKSPPQCWGWV